MAQRCLLNYTWPGYRPALLPGPWASLLTMLWLLASQAARAQAPTWQGVYSTNPVVGSNGTGNVACEVNATALNAAGDLLVVGTYSGTVDFPQVGGGSIRLLTPTQYASMYVGKWSTSSRAWLWAVGTPGAIGNDIAANGNEIYVTGFFNGGRATIAGTILTNANAINDSDGFLAKYVDNGTSCSDGWALKFGSPAVPSTDSGEQLAVRGANLYLVGRLYGTSTLAGTTITSAGQADLFLAKFDLTTSPATARWVVAGGDVRTDQANAVGVDGNNVYVGGNFANKLTLAGQTLTTTGLSDRNIFLAKFIDNGLTYTNGWAISNGGTGGESLLGLKVAGADIYFTGIYGQGTAGAPIAGTTLTTTGNSQMYVAKYTDAGTSATPRWAMGTVGASPASFSQGNELVVNGTSVFVTGTASGTVTLAGTTMTAAGLGGDAYVARFTDNTTSVTGSGLVYGGSAQDFDAGRDLEMRGATLYMGGYAQPNAVFGAYPLTSTGISSLSLLAVLAAANPLPVTLVAFTAQRQGTDGLLRWTTASEVNSAYFVVESAVEGRTFQAVGRVAGAGTSSHAHNYQFTDASLARYTGGQVYYRLRQVDKDGASTYSPARPVQVPTEAGLLVQAYPNPSAAATPVTLAIRVDHAGPVTLYLTDLLGRAISQQQTDLPTGLSTLFLEKANQLASGLYLLWVQQGSQQQVLTLRRQ